MVSVVVVPRSADARPQPNLDLLRRVRDFLTERSAPEASLVVLAPEYVRICVETSVVAESAYMGASVKTRCEETLMRFLHPVREESKAAAGNLANSRMNPICTPQLEAVEGLGLCPFAAEFGWRKTAQDLLKSGNFLISSGEHRIRLGA